MGVQATVVFTDLHGSTAVFEALGNLRATETVTQITTWIGEQCEAHGGRVVKTLGDGVLAMFPDGQSAVKAVVDLQRIHYKRVARTPSEVRMPIRIGVASGDVEIVAGDCYGDAVNVAARLCDLCGPNQIWANAAALGAVDEGHGVTFRILGPISIRGRAEPCTVYQIEWREEETSDFLTMQGQLDPAYSSGDVDVLGREIELTWSGQTKRFKAFDLPIHIGRVRNVEFMVNDPRVSRTHARLEWRNGSVVLVDVSTYGSWVRFAGANGSDVLLRREECVLHGQGELALGASFADATVPTVSFKVL
ncbi:adenylate/guanylate cyclase domain-containing protein [Rhodoferax saidenbachensis]|uniref:Adenylate/guanylate cyclase domain-containing protein n=1 Tax=Rhodoferax saidenbachensis TaxID=1484693 RepID=A0A1P8KA47_9BURK|nr:adenylate/guanylate cyclase domain-containing protein [Rhodoferax saidenbachensis]APW42874.1 adenylate/guanylate cyclase domain-containing protein [Rhodoferax saidenbachensis]